jgi:2-keto-4-pentenoate hydratase/2-oxohepta-3-ene-1,7-dioic acid hydratase in catechol pathway
MTYCHHTISGTAIDLPVGKVVCVGLNYQDHIKEMASTVTNDAVLFMKPMTAICALQPAIKLPKSSSECHNETEIAVLIKEKLSSADETEVMYAVWGIGLGLDLTLRDVQQALKKLGRPWELAKSFDNSCPLSGFIPLENIANVNDLTFSLAVNGELRQQGHSQLMIRAIAPLLSLISQHFTLMPGDVVMTGTPAGVAALYAGDTLVLTLNEHSFTTQVASL